MVSTTKLKHFIRLCAAKSPKLSADLTELGDLQRYNAVRYNRLLMTATASYSNE